MHDLEKYKRALAAALESDDIAVTDDSALHAGHGGWKAGAVTHITIDASSPKFLGLSRVGRQKLIYAALKPFMDGDLHAVRIVRADPSPISSS